MSKPDIRIEKDSMGEIEVATQALWGAQTQRAINNFQISNLVMPRAFIEAMGLIKSAAASVNGELKLLPNGHVLAIQEACRQVIDGELDGQFPVDVFQTGSGTSSNMNANEVIANVASAASGLAIHPNDHVNLGQSSNDVIPTAIHVSASLCITRDLYPALDILVQTIEQKSQELKDVVKTGRTHLMDAMPLSFGQELSAWSAQIQGCKRRLEALQEDLRGLAQGGTAIGTGINAHPSFAKGFAKSLSKQTGVEFYPASNAFAAIASQDVAVSVSGELKTLATALMKLANDLRWMNSGPLTGLGEISLPALQPGSSIMPGKVNPVIPEAVAMACAQVIGNDLTITLAGQSGNFQLNVMLPVVAHNLLQSIQLLSTSASRLAMAVIKDFTVNTSAVTEGLAKNPILVTALNPVIGYEAGARIAKTAYAEGRPVLEVALEQTDLTREQLEDLLDPRGLIQGGLQD